MCPGLVTNISITSSPSFSATWWPGWKTLESAGVIVTSVSTSRVAVTVVAATPPYTVAA